MSTTTTDTPACAVVLVVLNPAAGRRSHDAVRQALDATYRAHGAQFEILETSTTSEPASWLDPKLRAALESGCRLVVAAGGDGTIATVADALIRLDVGQDVRLGILPLGTANILARELGIPTELDPAISLLVEGRHAIALDAMRCRDRHYFTQVGVGLDADMIAITSGEARARYGRLAYFIAFLRRVTGHRSHRLTFDIDGRQLRVRAWQTVLANSATLATPPFTWGPGISPTDGVADLCVYKVGSPFDSLRLAWRLLSGHHHHDINTRYMPVHNVVGISSFHPLAVQADGDLIAYTPIRIRVVPHAVHVIAPQPSGVTNDASVKSSGTTTPTRRPLHRIGLHERQLYIKALLMRRIATVGAIDAALFLGVNGIRRAAWLDRAMTIASRLMHHGEAWVILVLIGLIVNWRDGVRVFWSVLPALWLATLTVNYPVKSMFRRHRPFISLVKAVVIGPKPLDSSFPSGHTAAAFGGAWLLALHYPLAAPAFFAFAILVGFSRVYLGVHYPSDVGIGALVGMVLVMFYKYVFRLLGF